MTKDHEGLSSALVETVAGLTAGSIATLTVHPLDIVKTRMQIHRSSAARPEGLTTVSLLRKLLQGPNPISSLYRGLTPNLLGSASSWASFFFFKVRVEDAIRAFKSPSGAFDHAACTTPLSPQDYFLSSGLAGLGVQFLTNPIWVLKTRMVSSDRSAAGAYPSMYQGARTIWATEGVRGFYRGLAISLFGVMHGAVQFAVYDPLKRIYLTQRQQRQQRLDHDLGHQQDHHRNRQQAKKPERISNEATLLISSVAKLVAGVATYPYQVIRSRLQNYDADERFGKGIRGVAARTWREEGWRGFYRGIIPGVVRVLPATWVTFLVYENVKYYLPQWAS